MTKETRMTSHLEVKPMDLMNRGVCEAFVLGHSLVIRHWSLVIRVRLAALLSLVALLLLSSSLNAQDEPNVPFIDQTLQRSDDFYSNGMKSLVEDVVKVAGMTDETKISELKKVAQESVVDKMAKSKTGLWKVWNAMAKNGDVDQNQFWAAYRKLPEAILTPDRSPIWEEGLKRLLNEAERAKWEAEASKRRDRIEKAIADYLNRGRDEWKDQRIEARKAQVEELVAQHQLDAPTTQKLRDGLASAVERALPSWGNGLEKNIREYVKSAFLGGAEDRLQMLEGGQINFGTAAEPEAMMAENTTWQELLKQTLSGTAFTEYEAREQQRLKRRNQALTLLAVSEVDRHLRLTASQRGKLEIALASVIAGAGSRIDAMLGQNYTSSEFILMVLNGVPEPTVKALLEADQQTGWDELAARYAGWWNQH